MGWIIKGEILRGRIIEGRIMEGKITDGGIIEGSDKIKCDIERVLKPFKHRKTLASQRLGQPQRDE
jgi:hypothetical protein